MITREVRSAPIGMAIAMTHTLREMALIPRSYGCLYEPRQLTLVPHAGMLVMIGLNDIELVIQIAKAKKVKAA